MEWWKTLDEAVEQLSHQQPGKLFGAYNTLIRECGNRSSLRHGRQVEQHILSTGHNHNQVLGDLLVQMYGKCGSLSDAQATFDRLPIRKPSSWNYLLRAYAAQRHDEQAFTVFREMVSQEIQPDVNSLVALLGICSSLGYVDRGKEIHEQAATAGLGHSLTVQKALINMYGKCRAVEQAEQIFQTASRREVGVWNSMIVAYAQNRHYRKALEVYKQMDVEPDGVTISSVLGACSNLGDLEEGRKAYGRGKHLNYVVVETAAVHMFGRCGDLQTARLIFDGLEQRNEITWNSIISAYIFHGRNKEALELYQQMLTFKSLKPSSSTYAMVVQACTALQDLETGTLLHSVIIDQGVRQSLVLQTALLNMYGRLGKLEVARELFDKMEEKNVVGYNVMITALGQHGLGKEALELYRKMTSKGIQPEPATFCAVLTACMDEPDVETGREIHREIEARSDCRSEVRLYNALVSMYGRCGDVESAKQVFDTREHKDGVSWNSMICAYAKNKRYREAVDLFYSMREQEDVTLSEICLSTVLHACSLLGNVQEGRRVHELISRTGFRSNVEVNVSLLKMYNECGRLDLAERLFSETTVSWPCPSPWTSMLTAYVKHGRGKDAVHVLRRMQLDGWKPEPVTCGAALSACYSLKQGRMIHALMTDNGFDKLRPVQDGLMNMYAQCGCLELAREVFDGMTNRTVVSWTIVIQAYEQKGRSREALELYSCMDAKGDDILYATVFGACASLGLLDRGKAIHEQLEKENVELGVFAMTGLLNMYAKCGKVERARELFESMGSTRTWVSWTAMITAYSLDSHAEEARHLCGRMVQEGVTPDGVTFVSLLMANSAKPDSTFQWLQWMVGDFGISLMSHHYECMVEVLSRAGWTEEAEEIVFAMPFEPKELTWTTLLGACLMHGDFVRGTRAAWSLLALGSESSSSYVLLSNLCAAVEGEMTENGLEMARV